MNAVVRWVVYTAISILFVTVLAACGLAKETKIGDVPGTAARIADITLPQGYSPEYALSLAGYTIAAYNRGDGHSHLFLVQAPEGTDVDQAKLEETLDQSPTGKRDRYTRMTVIENRPATIRGQQTTVVISEGTNSSGEAYRQATAAFPGKGGPALLVFSEPVSQWDMARVDALVGSVK